MAGAGYKQWVDGDILTAGDVNTYLMDQAVMVFADSSARSTAITAPSEGMVTFLKDIDDLQYYDGSQYVSVSSDPGKVFQVVSTTLDTTVSVTTQNDAANRYVDVTGLSATITPTSATSKILVMFSINGVAQNANAWGARITRAGTAIGVGASPSNRNALGAVFWMAAGSTNNISNLNQTVLDSPASTSSLTYQVQVANHVSTTGSYTVYVNRTDSDADESTKPRTASTITLMEIGV